MSVQQLGQLIKSRRKALKITQPHLAELAGVGINSLVKLERGMSNPRWETLEKIASVLGMKIEMTVNNEP